MKTILVGYEGSKKIIATSSYLLSKYMPNEFEFFFLNYGDYVGELVSGSYISLDNEQNGGSESWSKYIIKYLSELTDEFIIFSLDDYFLSNIIDFRSYWDLLNHMKNDHSIGAAKLGISPSYRTSDYKIVDEHIYELNKQANYSATTQFCIWRRQFLIEVLYRVKSSWEFELIGSDYINRTNFKIIGSLRMPLRYPEPSSISSRHPNKISVFANKNIDIDECINRGYLNEKDLIMGQWVGLTKTYSECKSNIYHSLDFCPSTEIEYYKMLLDICTL